MLLKTQSHVLCVLDSFYKCVWITAIIDEILLLRVTKRVLNIVEQFSRIETKNIFNMGMFVNNDKNTHNAMN
jgi:hypothetical protein